MENKIKNPYEMTIRTLPFVSGIFSLLVGTLVLSGWTLHVGFLKSIYPEFNSMKPNTALCFSLAGISLLLLSQWTQQSKKLFSGIAHTFSFLIIAITTLTLIEYAVGVNFGIDQLIHPEDVGIVTTAFPGRMTLLATFDFLLIGIALLFLNLRFTGSQFLQFLPLTTFLIGFLEILGYQYGIKPLYGIIYSQMAVHTSITFILLSLGIMVARPERGIIRIFTSQSLGGITLRRFLLGAILLPSFLGWIFLQLTKFGFINLELALTFIGITGTAILIVVIWWNARYLDQIDKQRRRAEDMLRQSELQYRTLIKEMGDGIIQTDFNETILLVNEQFCKILEYQEAELIGKNVLVLFPKDEWVKIASKTALRIKGISDRYEGRMMKKSGENIWVSVSGAPLFEADNKISGSVAIVTDITEQKRSQKLNEALYEIARSAGGSKRLEDLFKLVHRIISEVMPANNFYISLYDKENDLISFPYFVDEVDTPEPQRKLKRGLTEYVLRTGKSILCDEKLTKELMQRGEADIIGAPSPIWLGVPLIVENETIGVMVVQHYSDPNAYGLREKEMLEYVSGQIAKVIDRKRAEVELVESEERFRNLFDNVPVGIYRTTPDGIIINANPALIRMLGFSSLQELSKRNFEAERSEYAAARKKIKQILESEGSAQSLESTWNKVDGSPIYLLENAIAIKDAEGKIIFYEGMVEDISKRKRVEAEREKLILELQTALNEVKALSGLLPICASCKKIRDDTGYWNQLEMYIQTRSSVQFSHGICPDCTKKMYPQYYAKMYPEKQSETPDESELPHSPN